MSEDDIAIVGMACRVPGANTIAEFREALRRGQDTFTQLSDHDLQTAGIGPQEYDREGYVKRAPLLSDIKGFDPGFFGLSETETELMDPQQRLFLECAVEALEDSAVIASADRHHIGVFAGASISSYLLFNLLPQLEAGASSRALMAMAGNDKDYLASHTAYLLGLKGPAVGIQTACSSSLVSVHYAVQSLLSNECDVALAGGVSIRVPHRVGYQYEAGSILSSSGYCRSFDENADGTVFGSGAGIVTLCRLPDALKQHRHIYGVIRGSAVNNDGRNKAGYTAPGLDGQAAVVAEALAVAGLQPRDIGHLEAHGTGTPIGDPIEIRALDQIYGGHLPPSQRISVRTAKAIFGHLEAASGVVGLMAATVSIEDGCLPALPNFTRANPQLKLDQTPFTVSAESQDWPDNQPRCAGISSFGIGGTNAHVIVGHAPESTSENDNDGAQAQIHAVSAKSKPALVAAVDRHISTLTNSAADFRDLSRTSTLGREKYRFRAAVVATNATEAAIALENISIHEPQEQPRIGFVFSGQGGSSWPDIVSLRDRFSVFRKTLDRAVAVYPDLSPILCDGQPADPADTATLQAVLFALQAGLTETFRSMGIQPAILCGHSVGEIGAAWAAGILQFDDALRFSHKRGQLMGALSGGAMAVVSASETELQSLASDNVSIAAFNGKSARVLSGPADSLEAVVSKLASSGVDARMLPGTVAFHSPAIDPVVPAITKAASMMRHGHPVTDFISTLTGKLEDSLTADHWARHASEPVAFAASMDVVVASGVSVLVEIGPGAGLTALLRSEHDNLVVLPSVGGVGDDAAFLSTLAVLFACGCNFDWPSIIHEGPLAKLPGYPFQRTPYWLDAPGRGTATAKMSQSIWPDRPAWLAEHQVNGKTVMPAAGFLSFALSASGHNRLGSVVFERMLEIGNVGAELSLEENADGSFDLIASVENETPARCVSLNFKTGSAFIEVPATDRDMLTAVDTGDFYATMAAHGILLGPSLQKLSDIRTSENTASALIQIDGSETHGFGAKLHPCILDGMFQVLAASVSKSVTKPFVPASIDALSIDATALPPGTYQCDARLRQTGEADLQMIGDIRLYDEQGRCVVRVDGLCARAVKAPLVDFLYEPKWLASHKRALPSPSEVVEQLDLPELNEAAHLAYLDQLDRLAGVYVARAFEALQQTDREGLPAIDQQQYGILLKRYKKILEDDGLVEPSGELRAELPEPQPLRERLDAEFPDHRLETDMMARCGSALAAVLTQNEDPLSLLFGKGTAETGDLYSESELAQALNKLLVDAISQAVNSQERLNVLEIGAGTGGTTRHLLPLLRGRISRYLFTDISGAFFEDARRRFGSEPGFDVAVYNAELPPKDQLLTPNSFDLVVAANVLHATSDLSKAVSNASDALADGGWLVLLEGFRPSRWLDLTFALTKGWWNRKDIEDRPDYPLVCEQRWQELLETSGFDAVEILTLGSGRLAEQGIVIARKRCASRENVHFITAGLEASKPSLAVLEGLKKKFEPDAKLLVATKGAVKVRAFECPDLEQAAVTGLVKAVGLEEPSTDVRIVDIDPAEPDAMAVLRVEADIDDGEPFTAWRAGQRFVERLLPLPLLPRVPEEFQAHYSKQAGHCSFAPLERKELLENEVEIEIRAAGLNFKDVLTSLGMVPLAGPPGGECAGVISRVGDSVKDHRIGDRVMALGAGSFASHVTVPAVRVISLPLNINFAHAASIPVAGMTAYHVFANLARLGPDSKVLIHTATGGVGHYAIAFARMAGAEIFATAGSEWKRNLLRDAGVSNVFDSRSTEFAGLIKKIAPEGLDLVVNTLSGDATDAGLGLVRAGGTFAELGRVNIRSLDEVAAEFPNVNYEIVSLDQLDDLSGGELLATAFAQIADSGFPLPPLIRFPMAQLEAAMEMMKTGRHIGKIVVTNKEAFAFKQDSSYLITGGTGGIGMEVAEWASANGAGALHLTTRREPSAGVQARIAALRSAGTAVELHQLDLGDTKQLDALLDKASDGPTPLDGVFHAAGHLDDALLRDLTPEKMQQVAGPKSDAALHLSRRLPDVSAFVLFSSAAGVLGSPGQGNHAAASAMLDALADQRHAAGQHAIAIDWGAWSDIGAAHDRGASDRLKGTFVRPISPARGIETLANALDQDASRLVAIPIDNKRLVETQRASNTLIFDELRKTTQPASSDAQPQSSSKGSFFDELTELTPAVRVDRIARRVEENARRLMSIQSAELPHDRPLQEVGLDSLMAVELRNRLSELSGNSLPATVLYNYPTIDALAVYLHKSMYYDSAALSVDPAGNSDIADMDDEEILHLDETELDSILSDMEDRYGGNVD